MQPCKLCVTQHHFSNRPGAEGSIAAVSDVKHQPHILPCKRLEISSWLELSCRQASHPCAFVSPMSQTTLGSWTSLEGLIPGGHAGCCTPVRACRDPDAAVGVWELGSHPPRDWTESMMLNAVVSLLGQKPAGVVSLPVSESNLFYRCIYVLADHKAPLGAEYFAPTQVVGPPPRQKTSTQWNQ